MRLQTKDERPSVILVWRLWQIPTCWYFRFSCRIRFRFVSEAFSAAAYVAHL
jgi:hypothetical protein